MKISVRIPLFFFCEPEKFFSGFLLLILLICYAYADNLLLSEYSRHLIGGHPFTKDLSEYDYKFEAARLSYNFSYDCIYNEKVTGPDRESLKETSAVQPLNKVSFFFRRKNWGIVSSWDHTGLLLKLKESDVDYIFDARTDYSRLHLGGFYGYGPYRLDIGAVVNSQFVNTFGKRSYFEKFRSALFSPALDVRIALGISPGNIKGSLFYYNYAPTILNITIKSISNGAFRKIPFNLDINSAGLMGGINKNHFTGSLLVKGSKFIGNNLEIRSTDLPLLVSGENFSAELELFNRWLPYNPKLTISGTYGGYDTKGIDQSGSTYFRMEKNWLAELDGKLLLKFSRNLRMGLFAGYFDIDGGDGMLELYPFTSWAAVIGLPDRYKIYEGRTRLEEVGGNILKDWSFFRNHKIKVDGSVSWCLIESSLRTAELIRRLGLLPDYVNHTERTLVSGRYVVLNGGLEYIYDIKKLRLALKIDQRIPFETGATDGSGQQRGASENKRTVFGGFRGEAGITWKLLERQKGQSIKE